MRGAPPPARGRPRRVAPSRGRLFRGGRGEAGFTFVEVMVSLVLASLLGVALLGGLRSGQDLIGRATRDAARTARLVQLEALVRRGARQVRIPYWVREVEVGRGEDWLAIPYRRGEPSGRLVLRRRDGRLLIGGEGGTAGGGTGAGPAGGAAGGGAGAAGGTPRRRERHRGGRRAGGAAGRAGAVHRGGLRAGERAGRPPVGGARDRAGRGGGAGERRGLLRERVRPMSGGRMGREAGSTSMIVLGLLLFLSVLFAGAVLLVQRAAGGLRRGEERGAEERRLAVLAGRAARLLLDDPTPESDGPTDPVWGRLAGLQEEGTRLSLQDVGSRLGLNWVRKELLEEMDVLRPGRTGDELQQYREEAGLRLELLPGYGDFIDEERLAALFTAYGWFNVNVSDEFVLRQVFRLRRADDAEAEAFHGRVQQARAAKLVIGREELPGFLGEQAALLFPLVNAEPAMNVHYVPEPVLRVLLARYQVPPGRAEQILALREGEEWSEEDLEAMLGESYRKTLLHQYLGVRTWFWRIRVSGPRSTLTWTLARLPAEADAPGDDGEEEARLRLLEESLEP